MRAIILIVLLLVAFQLGGAEAQTHQVQVLISTDPIGESVPGVTVTVSRDTGEFLDEQVTDDYGEVVFTVPDSWSVRMEYSKGLNTFWPIGDVEPIVNYDYTKFVQMDYMRIEGYVYTIEAGGAQIGLPGAAIEPSGQAGMLVRGDVTDGDGGYDVYVERGWSGTIAPLPDGNCYQPGSHTVPTVLQDVGPGLYDFTTGAGTWETGVELAQGALSASSCSDVDGGFVVVWAPNGSNILKAQRYDWEMNPLWATGGIDVSPASTATPTEIQVMRDDLGEFVVVWIEDRASGGDLWMQRIDEAGNIQYGAGGLQPGQQGTNDGDHLPRLVAIPGGGAVVVWVSQQWLLGNWINPDGSKNWGESGMLIRNAQEVSELAVVTDEGNGDGFVVAWNERISAGWSDATIRVQRLADDGSSQWPVPGSPDGVLVGQSGQEVASLGLSRSFMSPTSAHVVFDRYTGPIHELHSDIVLLDGAPGTWPPVAQGTAGSFQQAIAWFGGDDTKYVVFRKWSATTGWDIYLRHTEAPNGPDIAVCTDLGDQHSPQVVRAEDGEGIVTWLSDEQCNQWNVYAQKVFIDGTTAWSPEDMVVSTDGCVETSVQTLGDGAGARLSAWVCGDVLAGARFGDEPVRLDVTMSGPSVVTKGESNSWSVSVSNSVPPLTYKWYWASDCGGPWTYFASGPSASFASWTNFCLKCEVIDDVLISGMAIKSVTTQKPPPDIGMVHELPPSKVTLEGNFPNPFNPLTSIRFGLPREERARIEIFRANGERVRVIVDEIRSAGWHTVTFDATGLSSGLYLYRFTTGSVVQTRKMVLLK